MKRADQKQKGFVLVEVIVAAAIITLVFLSLIGAYVVHFRVGLGNTARIQAAFLAEEGIEAIKFMRDSDWTDNIASLSTSVNYYLATSSTDTWTATTSASYINGRFTRTFRLSDVQRDASSNIVQSGGTVDSGTRKAVVTVSWMSQGGTTTRAISTYIMDLFAN